MPDQDNFYLITLNILITCLLDTVWILKGEFTCQQLLGVKGLKKKQVKKARSLFLMKFTCK